MHIKNKRGQSTVEYILLVTAVIAVIIVLLNGPKSAFQQQLNLALNTTVDDISTDAQGLADSHNTPVTNSNPGTPTGYNVSLP